MAVRWCIPLPGFAFIFGQGRSEGRMIHIENISNRSHELFSSRRGFLKGMLGAGAFVLSVRLMPEQMFASANAGPSDAMTKAPLRPNVYLAIDADGTTYLIAHRPEVGSGGRTALPRTLGGGKR